MRPRLEVIALGPADAAGAAEGGADQLEIVTDIATGGLTPAVVTVRDIKRACDLPVRVMLRVNDGFGTSGSELSRLMGAAHQLYAAGADGFVLGFLNPAVEIDTDATMALAAELSDAPWTFHRAIDQTLDHDRAWATVQQFPGLDTVLTAGSPRGVGSGLDILCARAGTSPAAAEIMMAGGGLAPDHVPWLARAGVRRFHIGSAARPGRSWKAYVDAGLVRSWRRLLDSVVPAG